jgi:hypothetical protein
MDLVTNYSLNPIKTHTLPHSNHYSYNIVTKLRFSLTTSTGPFNLTKLNFQAGIPYQKYIKAQ